MDREQQLTKLVNVLHRTARSAREGNEEVVERARQQYNRVLETLGGLEDSLKTLFTPLDEGASAAVIVAACKDVAAYFEDEVDAPEVPFDSDAFREFWRKSAKDLEDVGDFIRESLDQFQKERKEKKATTTNGESASEEGS
jgi:hypothetical protein